VNDQTTAVHLVAGPAKYDDVLLPFLSLMRKELHANAGKGDRPGWLALDANTLLLEVYWHAAKLSAAVKNNDGPAIMEHSADVANMAMMVLDACGGLAWVDYAAPVAAQPTSGVPVAPAGYALVPLEPTPAMFAADAPEDERPGDFGTMKYRRGIWKAMLAAAGVMAADEPLRWEFTGIAGLKRFLTQKQYEAQTPGTQEWYRPICPKCGPAGVDSSDGGQKK
jgi:hypothetical protein